MILPGPLSKLVQLAEHSHSADNDLSRLFQQNKAGNLHRWWHYFEIYERHFSRFRKSNPRVLEIGVQRGGSLEMWRNYFGPEAHIVGIDIDPACAELSGKAAEVVIGDQSDPEFLNQIAEQHGPFDIVLDDGGHMAIQQISTFVHLYPTMKERGVYLCEDTHTSLWKRFQDHPDGHTFLDVATKCARSLNDLHLDEGLLVRYESEPKDREGTVKVPYFTAATQAVCFYDSVVVFERAPKVEPYSERR